MGQWLSGGIVPRVACPADKRDARLQVQTETELANSTFSPMHRPSQLPPDTYSVPRTKGGRQSNHTGTVVAQFPEISCVAAVKFFFAF